ncbi:MAG: gliding motility-associated C-terminal domain-containing protein [Bacteroidota bacterium]
MGNLRRYFVSIILLALFSGAVNTVSAQQLFWVENNNNRIRTSNINGGGTTGGTSSFLTGLSNPLYLTVDESFNYLFYTRGIEDIIQVDLTTGGFISTVITNGAFAGYNDISASANAEGLYVSQFDGGVEFIPYTNGDGGFDVQLDIANLSEPVNIRNDNFGGVAVDDGNELVYVINTDNDRLYRTTDFSGDFVTLIRTYTGPTQIAIDEFNQYVFVVDRFASNDYRIIRTDLNGNNATTIAVSGNEINSIALAINFQQVYYAANDQIIRTDYDGAVGSATVVSNPGADIRDIAIANDFIAPFGYSFLINSDPVSTANQTNFSFTIFNGEVGATYNYTIDDTNGLTAPITGSGTITTSTQTISGIDVSSLDDDIITVSLSLTDVANNTGATVAANTLKDTTPPILSSSIPADGSTGINPDLTFSGIILSFNEDMLINAGSVELRRFFDDLLIESIDVTSSAVGFLSTSDILIIPTVILDPGTEYYVTIPSTAFADLFGNFYAGISNKNDLSFLTQVDFLPPNITNVSIPDNTMIIGDVVTATITVDDDQTDTYTLVSGDIGGYNLGSLTRVNNTTYTATFTVPDGGTDYAASDDIPVNGLALQNSEGETGAIFNGSISQANDLLDANRPDIATVMQTLSNPRNDGQLAYDIVFTEGVMDFDEIDFNFVIVSGSLVSSIGPFVTPISASEYNVVITGITGTGQGALSLGGSANFTDLAGNAYTANVQFPAYDLDDEAPAFNGNATDNLVPTGFDYTVNLDEIGTVEFIVTEDPNMPTVTDIMSGQDASGATAPASGTINVTATGTDFSSTITGLNPNTNYFIYDFAEDALGNTGTIQSTPVATPCAPPTTQASGLIFSNTNANFFDLTWTNGNGDRVLVIAKEGAPTDVDPVVGTTYTANATFGSGDNLGAGNFVVYDGTGNTFTVSGLNDGTVYHFGIYAYNIDGQCYLIPGLTEGHETCAIPAAPAGIVNNEYCEGSPTVQIAVSDVGLPVEWFDAPTGGNLATGVFDGVNGELFTPDDAGTYYAQYTNGNCIGPRSAVTLDEIPTLDPGTISADQTVCSNEVPADLIGTTPTGGNGSFTFLWESSNTGSTGPFVAAAGTNDQQNYSFSGATTQTIWFRRVVDSGPCQEVGNVVEITVNQAPTAVVLAGSASVCSGASTNLTATITGGTAPYSITIDDGIAPFVINDYNSGDDITVTPTVTLSYVVTSVTDANNCNLSGSLSVLPVTITFPPTLVTLSGDASICNGETTNLSVTVTGGTGPFDIEIDNGVGVVSGYNSGDPIPVNPSSTTTYGLVSLTDASGCPGVNLTGNATVVVTQAATASILSGDAGICQGESTDLIVDITGGSDPFTLQIDNGVGTITNYISGQPIPVSPTTNTTYNLVSVIDANNCNSLGISGTAIVTVSTPATSAVLSGGDVICEGESTSLVVNITGGIGPYTLDLQEFGIVNDYVSGTAINVNPTVTTLYFLNTVTDVNNCPASGLSGTVEVTVESLPAAFNLTNTGETVICSGTTNSAAIGLDGSEALISYQLLRDGNTVGAPLTGTGAALNFPTQTEAGVYTITGETEGSCLTQMNGSVTVTLANIPDAAVTIAGNSRNSVCVGDNMVVYTTSAINGATSYEWSFPAGFTAEGGSFTTNSESITVNVGEDAVSGAVTVVGINECGTGTVSPAFNVTVNDSPTAEIQAEDGIILSLETTFSFTSNTTISDVLWDFGDGNTSTQISPAHTYESTGDFQVSLELTNDVGCVGQVRTTVTVIASEIVSIKNVVTPNDDGLNDVLFIERIDRFPGNEVMLLDRWGVEVMSFQDYDNSWDLRIGGNLIPAGNYLCVVKLPNIDEVVSRTVTVIKE